MDALSGINSGGKVFNLFIDQDNNRELLIANQIKYTDTSFEDMLGAKLINEKGQNSFTCHQNEELPGFLKLQGNTVDATR